MKVMYIIIICTLYVVYEAGLEPWIFHRPIWDKCDQKRLKMHLHSLLVDQKSKYWREKTWFLIYAMVHISIWTCDYSTHPSVFVYISHHVPPLTELIPKKDCFRQSQKNWWHLVRHSDIKTSIIAQNVGWFKNLLRRHQGKIAQKWKTHVTSTDEPLGFERNLFWDTWRVL